jgi:truncated hemoglobin YjbI
VQNPTAYKLCKALRELESPVFVTDATAKTWFKVYHGDCTSFFSAGKLELSYGEQIRAQHLGAPMTAETMVLWLRMTHKVRDVGASGGIWGIWELSKPGCWWNLKQPLDI